MFFLSLFLIILFGLAFSYICKLIKLPAIIGYLCVGIIIGPFVLNLIAEGILNISEELRKIALIIILIRAGLSLKISDLKKIGRSAFFMGFLPALFEMVAIGLLAPLFFNISYLEAFILGSVVAAVSPAVVVPRMLKMIEDNQGTRQGVPELIVAGSSIDDVVVIVIFTALIATATSGAIGIMYYFNIPLSIILGTFGGVLAGLSLVWLFKKVHMRDTIKVLIICAICFGFVAVEYLLKKIVGFSGLIATISLGIVIASKYHVLAQRLSHKYSKLWILAEIFLFVLVGASVNITVMTKYLGLAVLMLICSLAIRSVGVIVSLIKTKLNPRERLFCAVSYLPKATVQAAIGGIPLALGIASGDLILSISVVSILFTAPLGAFLIDITKNKLVPRPTEL